VEPESYLTIPVSGIDVSTWNFNITNPVNPTVEFSGSTDIYPNKEEDGAAQGYLLVTLSLNNNDYTRYFIFVGYFNN
jgi:hypothetical protein